MAKKTSSFQAQPDSPPVGRAGYRKPGIVSRYTFAQRLRIDKAKAKVPLPWPPPVLGGLEAPEWLGMPRGDYPPEEK